MKDAAAKAAPILPIIPAAQRTEQEYANRFKIAGEKKKEEEALKDENQKYLDREMEKLPVGNWEKYGKEVHDKMQQYVVKLANINAQYRNKPIPYEVKAQLALEKQEVWELANAAEYLVKAENQARYNVRNDKTDMIDEDESNQYIGQTFTGNIKEDSRRLASSNNTDLVKYKFDVNKFVQTEKNWYKDQTIETPVFSNINGDYKLIRTERGLTPIGEKRLAEQTKLIWEEKKDKKVAGSNMTLAEQFGTYENFKENVRNAVTPPPTQSVRSPQQNYGYNPYQPQTYPEGTGNISYYGLRTEKDENGKPTGSYESIKVEGRPIIETINVDDKTNKYKSANSDIFQGLLAESSEAAQNQATIFKKGGQIEVRPYQGVLSTSADGSKIAWVRIIVRDKSDTENPDKEQSYLIPFNNIEKSGIIPIESNLYKWAKANQKIKTATTQKPSTPKQTFPEWKKSNPTGTYAQYQQYLKS